MYIQWPIIWAIYRESDSNNDANWNKPNQWTHNEFRKFKTGCRNGTIIPISSILPTRIRAENGPRLTDVPINRNLDDWNRAKQDGELTLEKLKQPAQWSLWLKLFLLKSKQESWNKIVNKRLYGPKNPLRPALVGDDLTLYKRQNNYVNVLLRRLITTHVGISILDKATDASNAFADLKYYHETSDIASAWSVILLDELDLLGPKDSASLGNFLSTFSTKVTEYDGIAPSPLS